MSLQFVALLDLAENHQKFITQIGCVEAKINLARSPGTKRKIINILAQDTNIDIRKAALNRCSDVTVLNKSFEEAETSVDAGLMQSLARNPYLPSSNLIKLLDHPNSSVKLLAYINPSTPEEARKNKLTTEAAQDAVETVGAFVEHMVRSYELVLANRFMTDSKNYWGVNISLALQLVGRKHSRWREASFETLLRHGGIYSDLELLSRNEMDYDTAVYIVQNKRDRQPEPSVMARIVSMYGSNILVESTPVDHSYISAAAWIDPFLVSHNSLAKADKSFLEIPSILGENITAWDNYKMLESSYEQNFVKMAETAVRL